MVFREFSAVSLLVESLKSLEEESKRLKDNIKFYRERLDDMEKDVIDLNKEMELIHMLLRITGGIYD